MIEIAWYWIVACFALGAILGVVLGWAVYEGYILEPPTW